MNRRTSIYDLQVPGTALLDIVINLVDGESDVLRAGAWAQDGKSIVLFRAPSVDVAQRVAQLASVGTEYELHTGVGVHRRSVK